MTVVCALAAGVLAGIVVHRLLRGVLESPVLARENYRGAGLPTSGGLVVVAAALGVEGLWSLLDGGDGARRVSLLVVIGFGLLGLLDDVVGSGDDGRGFRGHLRALRRGRLTTGSLKLGGGAALAVVAAAAVDGDRAGRLLVDAALIALAANLANLFDRAPGRVLKVGAFAGVALGVAAGLDGDLVGPAIAIGAALALLPADLGERLMVGDTGANALGAVLGLGVVLVAPFGARVGVLVAVAALNVVSEIVSFSRVIDRVGPLRWVDRVGRRAG